MTWAAVAKRLDAYERLIRLDKPIGTLLLLWPTLWALWLASRGTPPLAAGEIEPREALVVAAVLALAAFVLVLFLNRFAILLSFLGLAIAATYPSSKRYISLPQAYLGIAFGFGIPMAYAAVHRHLPLECWMLLAANVFYSFAYDTEYAMVDRDDDAKIGIRTSALTLGRWDVVAVCLLYTSPSPR